ncbi:MAG TPA: hypothetical protein ENK85_02860 [Saprospiraceae bacterium]|nr:hypothetical protein [Saprospiraceae bacterium]
MKAQIIVNAALKFFPIVLFFTSGFSHIVSDEQSVYIFTQLGWEPFGRYLVGFLEVVAGFLMILPGRSLEAGIFGSILALGMIVVHWLVLGTEIQGDDSYRFSLALILLVACLGLVIVHRQEIKGLPRKLAALRWRDIKMP